MSSDTGVSPSQPAREFVPDGYRSERLPSDVRDFIEKQATELSRAYHLDYHGSGDADYDARRHKLLSGKRWQWYGKGTERTVACLGTTFDGRPVYNDFRGVVVKFNPELREVDGSDNSPRRVTNVRGSGNLHELAVWWHATEAADRDLFGTILDYSDDGDWLAMKQTVPVYPYNRPTFANVSIDWISAKGLTERFKQKMLRQGYDPHVKDGNVGFSPERGQPVVIDYGAHLDIEAYDSDKMLTKYLLCGDTSKASSTQASGAGEQDEGDS